ncbi:myb-binding protein 1A [Drosophila bipectinata]|uniref:myb-binding protein 1A n=1 Tax=Drosophila bipectinata TaxID=42026 RepID=UPI001C8B02D1|nr:myb-binding protein 1A [Drosophila bipectinata]
MKVKVNLGDDQENTKGKPDRKRPKSGKSLSDVESETPSKIGKLSGEDLPSDEKENTPTNPMKLSDINKAVFGVFKKMQKTPLSQKIINSLIVLLRDDTNIPQRTATCAYVLKRFVRSTGADDIQAVSLAASYIHCILSSVPGIDALEVLATMRKDLAVGSQQKGKEDTLAAVGQMVTAYSILQTPQFVEEPDPKLVAAVYEILVSQLKGREYLVLMCSDIIADSFKTLPDKLFMEHVWPLLQRPLNKPLSGLKVNTCDILLSVHLEYPSILVREQLLVSLWTNEPQYAELFELYIAGSTIHSDGVYSRLARFIASGGQEVLSAWQQFVDAKQPIKFNSAKACIIQVLGHIILNYDNEDEQPILDLFTPTTIQFLIQELSSVKSDKSHVKKPSQQELRDIVLKFEGILLIAFEQHLKKEETKLQLLQKFLAEKIQLDWVISLPRFSHQVIACLGVESLKTLFEFYQTKLTNLSDEDKSIGTHCLNQLHFILQNSELAEKESKWRNKQLRQLMVAALFHLDGSLEPCLASEASLFSRQCSARCEEIFLNCLLHKCPGLPALVQLLRKNFVYLNKQLAKDNAENKLLHPRDKALLKAWPEVEKLLKEPSDESDDVAQSFEALIYFVAIALCTKSTLPFIVLDDLIICRKNALGKVEEKPDSPDDASEDKPEWQDVLTDALLQMLLQTGHFWREFVNLIVSSVIPQLRNNNLEQILEVLNMNKNPLSKNDEDDDSYDEESDDENSSSEDEDGEDQEADDKDSDEDGDETYLAQIRESVRLALEGDGQVDDDGSSVDWNDVDEAQGQRLNAALERSFQLYKPKSAKAQAKQGPTKSERIDITSLMHFRIRALDLLDLFTTHKPTQGVILDVLLCAFQVFRYSVLHSKHQPIQEASLKLLKKVLAKNINFESNPDKSPILEAIEQLLTTGEKTDDDDNEKNKQQTSRKSKAEITAWRDKCFAYLVNQGSMNEDPKKSAVWPQLVKLLDLWVANRNTILSLGSFEALFQAGQWAGVAPLAVLLVSHLDLDKTRSLRRAQILKLFAGQFRRLEGALQDEGSDDAKEFEQHLVRYVTQLEESDKYSAKELELLQKILTQGGEKRAQLLEKIKIVAQKPPKNANEEEEDGDEEPEEVEEMDVDEEGEEPEKKKSKKTKKATLVVEGELDIEAYEQLKKMSGKEKRKLEKDLTKQLKKAQKAVILQAQEEEDEDDEVGLDGQNQMEEDESENEAEEDQAEEDEENDDNEVEEEGEEEEEVDEDLEEEEEVEDEESEEEDNN